MRFLGKLAIAGGLIVGVLWIYGTTLPRTHRATSTITLVASPEAAYATMRDMENLPRWWSDVNRVTRIKGAKRESWERDMRGGDPVQVEVTSAISGQRFVTTFLNDSIQGWGGTWTHDVRLTGSGTEVTLTEEGWIEKPLQRVMMKIRGGHHRLLDGYLRSLGAHLGETVSPRHNGTG